VIELIIFDLDKVLVETNIENMWGGKTRRVKNYIK
jgi:hypothetical protein